MARRPGSEAARKPLAGIPCALENAPLFAADGQAALDLAAAGRTCDRRRRAERP